MPSFTRYIVNKNSEMPNGRAEETEGLKGAKAGAAGTLVSAALPPQ